MSRRATPFAVVVLTMHCISWLAVAPMVPSLHQALASHLHVYNTTRFQFEDAGPKQPRRERIRVANEFPQTITATDDGSSQSNARNTCDFSNFNLPACTQAVAFPTQWVIAGYEQPSLGNAGAESAWAQPVLGFAPKRSPPPDCHA